MNHPNVTPRHSTTKISLVTTCFNASLYIGQTLESVLRQEGNFQLHYIIVDGGSIDDTLQIINRKINEYKKLRHLVQSTLIQFTVISDPDNGLYDGLSKGFRLISSDTDVVAYINADDIYLPNAMSTVATIFHQNPNVSWVTGRQSVFNADGSCIPVAQNINYKKNWISKGYYGLVFNPIQQESTFWRRSLLDEIDLDKLKTFRYAGDFYIWKVFSEKYQLYCANVCLAGFRKHSDQLSDNRKQYRQEMDQIRIRPNSFESLVLRVMRKVRRFLPHVLIVYLASQFTIDYRQSTNSWSVMSRRDRIAFAKRQTRL